MFYNQSLLLYYMFRSHKDHHQVFYMNTVVTELLIWIHISEYRSSNILYPFILTYCNTQQDAHREDNAGCLRS
jgi:hypothetical protein